MTSATNTFGVLTRNGSHPSVIVRGIQNVEFGIGIALEFQQ
jgi:hypothetical protein